MNNHDLVTKFETYLLTEKRVSDNTFHAYKRDLWQCMDYLASQGIITYQELRESHLKSFLSFLRSEGVSARSAARKISCLRSFFSFTHKRYQLTDWGTVLELPKLERKLPHYLTEKEVELLFTTLEQEKTPHGVRNLIMLYMLYVTGMRITELVELNLSDIQFDTSLIMVSGKGGKQRLIPLASSLVEKVKEYIHTTHPQLTTKGSVLIKTNYLFPVVYGGIAKHISRQAFWAILKDAWRKSGIKHAVSPHKLRHSFATHMLTKGADLRSLQMLLGHETIATVQIYTHVEKGYLRTVYDKKHPRS